MNVYTPQERGIIDAFHVILYSKGLFGVHWKAGGLHKCPFDVWNYVWIIQQCKPTMIIASGIQTGGDVVFYADMAGPDCQIIGIDIDMTNLRQRDDRVKYIAGDAIGEAVLAPLRDAVAAHRQARSDARIMVILDDDHTRDHVARELVIYGEFVTPGQYMICEDSNINGHPVLPSFGPGAYEALVTFLQQHSDRWELDRELEQRYPITQNPLGYLKKKH